MIYWPVGPGYNETEGADEGLLANLLPLYKQEGWLKEMPTSPSSTSTEGCTTSMVPSSPAVHLLQRQPVPKASLERSFEFRTAVRGGRQNPGRRLPAASTGQRGWMARCPPIVDLDAAGTQLQHVQQPLFSWAKTTATPTSWMDPAVVKAFNVLKEMQHLVSSQTAEPRSTDAEAETVFEDGKAAMVQCPLGCYGPQAIADLIGSRFKVGILSTPGLSLASRCTRMLQRNPRIFGS